MSNKTIGFGIIGTGAIAHIHAQAIASIDGAVLLGVYSRTIEKAQRFGLEYEALVADSMEEFLQLEGLDIVCICTPSGAHLEPALQSIAAGKHCLIEKPIEVTLERSDLIIARASAKGVKITTVFPTRFEPLSQLVKEALDSERFGKLVLGSAYVKWSRSKAYYASAEWRGTWTLDGGGVLMNQAIHSVDMLQWYMGPVHSVQALTTNIEHQEIEVEDTVVAIVKFKNGALGTIECTTAGYPGLLKRLEIVGTKGTAVIEGNNLLSWQFQEEADEDDKIRQENSGLTTSDGSSRPMDISYFGHQQQIIDFIAAIRSDSAPFIDGEEGRKSLAIILAIYDSAASGKEVIL